MRTKVFIFVLALFVVAGGIYFLIRPQLPFGLGIGASNHNSDVVVGPVATSIPPTPKIGQGLREYKNSSYHFQLDFPDTLQATEYKEANNAITVTFANADNSQSFEMYITPYQGSQIDQARFKLDEPSGRYLDPQNVVIDGAQATLFTGYNPIMSDTREVWFIKNGYLYEVATYKDLDMWLGTIMQSFKFI